MKYLGNTDTEKVTLNILVSSKALNKDYWKFLIVICSPESAELVVGNNLEII